MRVLITGAAGKIGRKTTETFITAGHEVVATDHQFRPGLSFPLQLADLCDAHSAYRLMEGVDAVVHGGNIPNAYGMSPPQRVLIENLTINANVFTAAVHLAIPRLVFVSTIQVMLSQDHRFEFPARDHRGKFPYLPVDGLEPQNPGVNFYAQGKAFSEQSLSLFAKAYPAMVATTVRFPYVADDEGVRKRNTYPFPKAGGQATPDALVYLHLDDAARFLLACAGLDTPGYRQYLPCQSVMVEGFTPRQTAAYFFPDLILSPAIDEIDTLVDLRRTTRETGWRPTSTPLLLKPLPEPV